MPEIIEGSGWGRGGGTKKGGKLQEEIITGGWLQMEGKSVRHLRNIRGDLPLAS